MKERVKGISKDAKLDFLTLWYAYLSFDLRNMEEQSRVECLENESK